MTISEEDIDRFISQFHSSNSGRAAAQRIVYGPALAANLKALSFTLKGRASCNALYDAAGLAALDQAQLALMQTYRDQALQEKENDDAVTLPEIDVPKFTTDNYDDFMATFLTVISQEVQNSKKTPRLSIGTTGHGANLVKQFQPRYQGFQLHFAFVNHFANDTYLQNKAAQAATDLTKLNYSGDKEHFKMEDYYNRMTQCFNDLANGGAQYTLNDHQKIQAFSWGLKNATAVRYHVDTKQAWDAIQGPKDFDTYYNLFSSKLQQYRTLIGDGSHTDNRRINNVDTGGRGRSRRGGRFGRGGGRGRSCEVEVI
ncbi:predicted protein [Chaetoceros tenuissimus]|uniref:Uncharacterized protein n=1 Tax=Chaetoceros tenuissimus TaxID=426638 RepID=A0AAD3DDY5_9STRA|nr:predicted protein [Chaetoceros tenuissimus]